MKVTYFIIKDGKELTSPNEIAQALAEGFIEKVYKIKKGIQGSKYELVKTYKKLILCNENSQKLKTI